MALTTSEIVRALGPNAPLRALEKLGGPGMIDPITLEVLREAFVSIVREMRVTLVRTAYSSILYEGEDFSCVLMDGAAQIVAMSKGQDHPLHIVAHRLVHARRAREVRRRHPPRRHLPAQ